MPKSLNLYLGLLGEMVEVFKIGWVDFGGNRGPSFTIYFRDPMGKTMSHGTDFRFIGKGQPFPSAEDIKEHLCSKEGLRGFISEHIGKCEERLLEVQQKIKSLSQDRRTTL